MLQCSSHVHPAPFLAVPVIFSKTNINSRLSASTVAPKKETWRNKSHHEVAESIVKQ